MGLQRKNCNATITTRNKLVIKSGGILLDLNVQDQENLPLFHLLVFNQLFKSITMSWLLYQLKIFDLLEKAQGIIIIIIQFKLLLKKYEP